MHQYNGLVPTSECLQDSFLKTILKTIVSGVPKLDAIKTQEHIETIKGNFALTYQQYFNLILNAADLMDTIRSATTRIKKLSANQHDFSFDDEYNDEDSNYGYDDYDDDMYGGYEANVAAPIVAPNNFINGSTLLRRREEDKQLEATDAVSAWPPASGLSETEPPTDNPGSSLG